MQHVEERIKRLLQELETRIYPIKTPVSGIRMKKTRDQYDPSAGINTTALGRTSGIFLVLYGSGYSRNLCRDASGN